MIASAIKAHGERVASALEVQGAAVAAAVADAAEPNWAERWGVAFAAIAAAVLVAKAAIAVGKLCWPVVLEKSRGRMVNESRRKRDVEMGMGGGGKEQ